MDPNQMLGYAAGALTTISFIPQVIRAWRTHSCRDLSWGMLLIFSAGVLLWLIYGIRIDSMPVIVTNAVTLALCLVLIFFKFRYPGQEPRASA